MSEQIPSVCSQPASLQAELTELSGDIGAGLVGSWLAMVLYGLALSQTYTYFAEYPKDSIWNKALVWIVCIINTLHLAFTCHAAYHVVVNGFNPMIIIETVWSFPASVAAHVVVAFVVLLLCVQMTSRRARWWLLAVLLTPIGLQTAFGIDLVIRMALTTQLLHYHDFMVSTAIPMLLSQITSDITISVALCIILNKHRTPFKRTNSMISTLVKYSINRGIFMFLLAVVELLLMLIQQKNLWYVASEFMISGLYTNTLLATLNSRNTVREVTNKVSALSIPLSDISSSGPNSQSSGEPKHVRNHVLAIGGKGAYDGTREVDIVDLGSSTCNSENASEKV